MAVNGLFSLGEFAKYSRTTRDTLHYYDKIGLLCPISRGDNNYRYYSSGQLMEVNVIRTLQALGLSLGEIKEIISTRTPSRIEGVLSSQTDIIQSKIDSWQRARDLLAALRESIRSGINADENLISIRHMPEERVIMGERNEILGGRGYLDALLSFYGAVSRMYPCVDLNYPVWGVFSRERIAGGDWHCPDRFYFYNPEGQDIRPAGLYAVGYTRGGYGGGGELYGRLLEYICQNGYSISGDAYEEYPLNELTVPDESGYLKRIMIKVESSDTNPR
jgi:DNA-binding transcriptional MerR regulator